MPGGKCVQVTTDNAEFFDVFASQFRLSDGSLVSASAREAGAETSEQWAGRAREFAQRFLGNVGVTVVPGSTAQSAFAIQICDKHVLRNVLLSVVGNFVLSPGDPEASPSSSTQAPPTVVVDPYTWDLMTHVSYSGVRGYFVEALLVVSIVVIARLTFVRNTPYFTFVHTPASSSSSAPEFVGRAGMDGK